MTVYINDFGVATTKLGFVYMEPSININIQTGRRVPSISLFADKQLRIKSYTNETERNNALIEIEAALDKAYVPCELIPNTAVYINGFNILSVTKRAELNKTFSITIEFTQGIQKVLYFPTEEERENAYEAILKIAESAGEAGDYNSLDNLPSLNGVKLKGDLTNEEVGIPTKTSELENDANFVPYQVQDGTGRKFIVLMNHDGLQGEMTDGSQVNLAMVSKWDVADFGSSALHYNMNSKDYVTINDTDIVATFKNFENDRYTLELRNHDNISGLDSTGTGHNLAMVSKWDVADFGAVGLHANLNTKDVVTINDKDVVATDKDLALKADKTELENTVIDIDNKLNLKADKATTYTKTEVDSIIAKIDQFKVKVVDTLPETGEELTVYLVPKDSSLQEDDNVYDEYIWTENRWEHIGDTKIDLSDYITNAQLAEELAKKQDNLIPSENLVVDGANIDVNAQRVVLYSLYDNRKFIQMANHDALSGITTTGDGINLAMVSKWDVADFGSSKVHMNLNTKDVITVNDKDVVATDKDLALKADKTAFDTEIQKINTELETKANKIEVENSLALKADKTELEQAVTELNTELDKKEDRALYIQIPLRTLKDEIYSQETILKWFGVESIPELKGKIAGNTIALIKWGISLSTNPHYYRFVPEYLAFESANQIKLVFNGLDTSNDESCKYEILINLDGTIIEGNSNVSLKILSVDTDDVTADQVEYINGDIKTVKEALDQLLYISPDITSFTGGGTYEKGSTINSINLSWTLNKEVTSQSINQGIGDLEVNLRKYDISDANLTEDTTYTLTVSDGKNSDSASTSVLFRQKRYWGVSTETSLTNEQVLALSQEFSTGRNQNRTFDCSGGKYFYFVIPTQYCNGIQFKVGGLSFTGMEETTIQLTNASGYEASYNVYRCSNIQTGSAINVEVF